MLRLSVARYISVLVHNHVETDHSLPSWEDLESEKYSKERLSFSMEASLHRLGVKRARKMGIVSFSVYVEALIRFDLGSKESGLTIFPIRGTFKPRL